eukprot:scaffold93818_cov62-Phaeocystis_antarctica.AAC.7
MAVARFGTYAARSKQLQDQHVVREVAVEGRLGIAPWRGDELRQRAAAAAPTVAAQQPRVAIKERRRRRGGFHPLEEMWQRRQRRSSSAVAGAVVARAARHGALRLPQCAEQTLAHATPRGQVAAEGQRVGVHGDTVGLAGGTEPGALREEPRVV